jgi:hypothetical protein
MFPDRPVERIAVWAAHRSTEWPRELWRVGPPSTVEIDAHRRDDDGVSVGSLLALDVAWPPRSWWLQRLPAVDRGATGEIVFTSRGLERRVRSSSPAHAPTNHDSIDRLIAEARRIPERGATTWRRRVRRVCEAVRRRIRAVTTL